MAKFIITNMQNYEKIEKIGEGLLALILLIYFGSDFKLYLSK